MNIQKAPTMISSFNQNHEIYKEKEKDEHLKFDRFCQGRWKQGCTVVCSTPYWGGPVAEEQH